MKKLIFILIVFVLNESYSQSNEQIRELIKKAVTDVNSRNLDIGNDKDIEKYIDSNLEYGKNSRISMILGVGAGYTLSEIYLNPSINPTNKNVAIEKGQRMKTNVSLGVVYVPFTHKLTTGEVVPKGFSIATFINPISFTGASSSDFFSMTDFGIGFGHKFAGNFLMLFTLEFLTAKQPKDWFLQQFGNDPLPYLIDGSPQLSFDINNSDIFKNRIIPTLGFKFCYTFDVIKNFNSLANSNDGT